MSLLYMSASSNCSQDSPLYAIYTGTGIVKVLDRASQTDRTVANLFFETVAMVTLGLTASIEGTAYAVYGIMKFFTATSGSQTNRELAKLMKKTLLCFKLFVMTSNIPSLISLIGIHLISKATPSSGYLDQSFCGRKINEIERTAGENRILAVAKMALMGILSGPECIFRLFQIAHHFLIHGRQAINGEQQKSLEKQALQLLTSLNLFVNVLNPIFLLIVLLEIIQKEQAQVAAESAPTNPFISSKVEVA